MKKELKNFTEDSEILKNNFGYDDNQIETLWKQFLDNQTNQTLIVDNLTLISKKDKKTKLNKVSFEIMPKTFHVFIGNNGAGKSTTIKCMIGLIENYQGSIYLKNLGYLDRDQIAYVPDAIPKFPTNMTTREYLLKTAILLSHQKPEVIQTKLNSYVQKFSMGEYINKHLNKTSFGERRKILLVSALLLNKKFIILDEPFVNLDHDSKMLFMNELKEMSQKNVGVFLSSHGIKDLSGYATDATFIKHGKVILNTKVTSKTFIEDFYNDNYKKTGVDDEN